MTVVARRTRNTIVHDAAAVAVAGEEHSSSNTTASSSSNSNNVINRMHTRRRSALNEDPLLVKAQHHHLISNSQSPRPDIDADMANSSASITATTILKKGKGRWPKKEDSNSNTLTKDAASAPLPPLSTRRLSSTSTATASSSSAAVSRPVLMKAAKSRSNRGRASLKAVEQDDMEGVVEDPPDDEIMLHEVPDNVINHAGLTEIPSSLIDSLPNVAFPKQGVSLAPQDTADPLLILIGKVLASVDNRALTPKEIALILARRHGWQFSGTQPFAIVSSCIRAHVRRASLATPPYSPIFSLYELSTVPPVEDIPCLGIQAEAKPVVKRGSFWYLASSMGYGLTFPHRQAPLLPPTQTKKTPTAFTSALPPLKSGLSQPPASIQLDASSSTSAAVASTSAITPAPASTQRGHLRSSSRRYSTNTTTLAQSQLPIPIMPAPAPIASAHAQSKPKLESDRLTRAQRHAAATGLSSESAAIEGKSDVSKQVDPLGRGKRKRTISAAPSSHNLSSGPVVTFADQIPEDVPVAPYPHMQAAPNAQQSDATMLNSTQGFAPAAKPASSKPRSAVHRRAFSSSAGDTAAAKPLPALRKLKLRLSAVSETSIVDEEAMPSTTMSTFSSSLPDHASLIVATKKKLGANGKPTSNKASSSKQPKSKRQRTQSMSQRTNTTASFPFDDLHLHHSMQQQFSATNVPSLHNPPSFHHSQSFDSAPNADGTLYPLDMHHHSLHLPSPPGGDSDLFTSRSAPESNIFSPSSSALANTRAFSFVAGPFSRSHSPSGVSTPSTQQHQYYTHQPGRRSLPPENGSQEDLEAQIDHDQQSLQYDGWGTEQDRADISPGQAGDHSNLSAVNAIGSTAVDFHEAMLKNDDIDFAFDFSLGSLGASALHISGDDSIAEEVIQIDNAQSMHSLPENDERVLSEQDIKASSSRRSQSILDMSSFTDEDGAINGSFEGLDDMVEDNSGETVKQKQSFKIRNSTNAKTSPDSTGLDAGDMAAEEQDHDEEHKIQDDATSAALMASEAFERALNTTLCPAAAKLGEGGSSRPARLLAKRMNITSNLTFARANSLQPILRSPQSLTSPTNTGTYTSSSPVSLLRPSAISRTNSRDVLSSTVPLAELPSIPLEDKRRDSFLFFHLTSEAEQPGLPASYDNVAMNEDEDDDASSSAASSSSSLLSRMVKSEEELDEMVEMKEGQYATRESTSTRSRTSRCSSSTSALSRAELESNDSFNPEMIYPMGRRAPSADLGVVIGGRGEMDDLQTAIIGASRSQSSSRTTSLSPRDSFSPNLVAAHHHLHHDESLSDTEGADWALTPPSEEEHVDEEEKDLDRATMLGLESVGMDDLDDVWPGALSRRSALGSSTIEAQVEGVTSELKIMEVFEPILPAAPIPQADLQSPINFTAPLVSITRPKSSADQNANGEESEETLMDITEPQPMDEHMAAAMFIADESLHPPKPASIDIPSQSDSSAATSTIPDSEKLIEPSLSPVSAAARDATSSADAQTSNSSAETSKQHSAATQSDKEPPMQSASTQSFLFYPEKPFQPELSILLTDTKILFYSTVFNVALDGRPLLRRVDNDAVDAEALLSSLECSIELDMDRLETLRKIKELGNTWVSLDFARELLNKFGGPDPPLRTFLADNILLSWNEKLVKLGTMLRKKNGLPTPVPSASRSAFSKGDVRSSTATVATTTKPSTSPRMTERPIASKPVTKPIKSSKILETVEQDAPMTDATTEGPSSPQSPKKEKKDKAALARRASSRNKLSM